MNFWIQRTPKELAETLKLVNVLLITDTETKMLAAEKNLPRAANKVLAMGPSALVVKHGEYGATIFFREGAFGLGSHPFRAPALPIEEVKDPTGAGDSFAGGFMGYLASHGEINLEVLKRALVYGGVMGSFGLGRFLRAARVRFADSRAAAIRDGVVAPTSSADDPVHFLGRNVAERVRRFDSFDDRLRAWSHGNIPPRARHTGSRPLQESGHETGGCRGRMGSGFRFRSESKPYLHCC